MHERVGWGEDLIVFFPEWGAGAALRVGGTYG